MNLKDKNIFLSGPMSAIPYHNVPEFAKAHAIVKELGASHVYNPALKYLEGQYTADAKPHEWWMAKRINELTHTSLDGGMFYDLIVMLPGWRDSSGALEEWRVACACGIPYVNLGELE